MSIVATLARIEEASPDSPIAVFRSTKEGSVNAVFASTVESRRQIEIGIGLVGVFNRTDDIAMVRRKLLGAV